MRDVLFRRIRWPVGGEQNKAAWPDYTCIAHRNCSVFGVTYSLLGFIFFAFCEVLEIAFHIFTHLCLAALLAAVWSHIHQGRFAKGGTGLDYKRQNKGVNNISWGVVLSQFNMCLGHDKMPRWGGFQEQGQAVLQKPLAQHFCVLWISMRSVSAKEETCLMRPSEAITLQILL